jgi:2-methylisocitrate lyase-like PEP mutase family enzyme
MNNYAAFYQLHHQDKPFVLANAWNVKSAQIIEQCGYEAIGTSSGAISNSLGYPDGEKIPFGELLYMVQRIKACTTVPLSVDLERGYTDNPDELIENIQRLVDIGVAGINLEDVQGEELFLKKLGWIKAHLVKTGQHLFINARTDGFLLKQESPLEKTIKRAKLYQDAGADGLFVTAVSDTATIKAITASTTLPVNVVGSPKLSSFKALSECGVRRISMAVLLYKSTYSQLERLAKEVNGEESLAPLF